MTSTTSEMTLKQWYKGITVPRPTSHHYRPFIASCVGIVNKIVERELERSVTVRFGETPTAYADQENSLIVISNDFAQGDFSEASGGKFDTSEDIIPQILGIIVHEAAHFAFSPKDLTIIAKGVERLLGRKVNQNVVMRLGNVVEDIFIEWEVGNRIPQVIWMLDRLNKNLLGTEAFLISRSKVMGQIARPINTEELANTVGHLIFAKVRFPMATTPYMDNLWTIAQSAREAKTVEERIEIVAELYELIMIDGGDEGDGESGEEESEDGEKQVGDSQGKGDQGSEETDGEKTDGKATQGSPSLEGSAGDEAIEQVIKELTAALGGDESKPGNWVPWDVDAINKMISKGLQELESDDTYDGKLVTKNRVTPVGHHSEMEVDSRYAGLAKIGRQRATTNRPYGVDQRRGHSIRKLHRIATDGRIFAEPMKTQSYKPMEVIILVDCSGSMQWGHKIWEAGKAAIGAAAGLKAARCEVQITGHTADIDDIDLTLYTIKEWSDPVSVASKRMRRLVDGGSTYKLCQNRDHLAIEEVAKDFRASSKQRRRLLIVISDGEPAATGGYGGPRAQEATRKAVDEVRKQGIDVTSISITEEAARANNWIYGKEHNVCNDDPNVIEQIVRQLIMS
jgi:Mg-chelatase subunit ChlD